LPPDHLTLVWIVLSHLFQKWLTSLLDPWKLCVKDGASVLNLPKTSDGEARDREMWKKWNINPSAAGQKKIVRQI
jgi:hypothetical protein